MGNPVWKCLIRTNSCDEIMPDLQNLAYAWMPIFARGMLRMKARLVEKSRPNYRFGCLKCARGRSIIRSWGCACSHSSILGEEAPIERLFADYNAVGVREQAKWTRAKARRRDARRSLSQNDTEPVPFHSQKLKKRGHVLEWNVSRRVGRKESKPSSQLKCEGLYAQEATMEEMMKNRPVSQR